MSTPAAASPAVELRWLGRAEYEPAWRALQQLTDQAGAETREEIWFLEHPPVFTMGMNAKPEHLLAPGAIPVVNIDRGGEVTYHGPGQLVVYPLIDLNRHRLGVRALVAGIEAAVIATVARWGIAARGDRAAPGVYVQERKLASIGLRIRRGRSYHGLALNVAMDLEPFRRINPCGHAGLQMTQLGDLGGPTDLESVAAALAPQLLAALGLPQSATSTWRQEVSSR